MRSPCSPFAKRTSKWRSSGATGKPSYAEKSQSLATHSRTSPNRATVTFVAATAPPLRPLAEPQPLNLHPHHLHNLSHSHNPLPNTPLPGAATHANPLPPRIQPSAQPSRKRPRSHNPNPPQPPNPPHGPTWTVTPSTTLHRSSPCHHEFPATRPSTPTAHAQSFVGAASPE